MKKLEDFKEEIHRCSKCGICQSVCPLFELTGNECSVSRGQFIMLNGVINKELKLNKNINKYLDLCLKCGKCSNFCPSEIDVVQILMSAKYEYFKKSFSGKIYSILESKAIFNTVLKLVSFVSGIFFRPKKSKKFDKKAVWFGGCVEKAFPQMRNFVIELLNHLEIEVLDVDFNCCGIPFMTTGNLDRFKEQVMENIKKLDFDFDYFITDCASCLYTWKQYEKYVEDKSLQEQLKSINFKSIYELIAESDIRFKAKKNVTVSYHKPCHEQNEDAIFNIINKCENIQFVQMQDYDKCCGFAGFEHPITLKTLNPVIKNKADKIKQTNADCIITSCVGCLLSIKLMTFFKQKTKRLLEFLKEYCEFQ